MNTHSKKLQTTISKPKKFSLNNLITHRMLTRKLDNQDNQDKLVICMYILNRINEYDLIDDDSDDSKASNYEE